MRLGWLRLRRPLHVGVLAATAGTLAFFWPLLFGYTFSTVAGHMTSVYPWAAQPSGYLDFPQTDQADLNYPWQAFLSRSLRSGELPLWNPLSFGGQPFFSNGSSGVLYPPRLAAGLALSPSAAHDLLSVIHVFGAGLAMFLFCRQLRLGTAASVLGATAWMFASFNMAWLHLEVVAPVTVLLPLSLWAVRRAVRVGSRWALPAAAAVLGVTLVSGHLLMMGSLWATAVAYAVWCAIGAAMRACPGSRSARALRSGWRAAVLVAGGPALFAAVLLPTAATIRGSHRQELNYEWVHAGARSDPRVLLNLFLPPALPVSAESMNREMAFVGTLAGLLAVAGLFRRGPAPALGRAMAAAVLLLALDTPVLKLAYWVVPGLTLIRPLGRLFFLLDFALALLAAAGLEAFAAGLHGILRRSGATSGIRAARGSTALEIACALIVLVNTGQLVRYARAINPPFHPRTKSLLYPETPLISAIERELAEHGGRMLPTRRMTVRWTRPILFASEHMIFGLPSLGGYDSVIPDWALKLNLVVSGGPVETILRYPGVGAYFADFDPAAVRFELLPRVGVTAVVTPPRFDQRPSWVRETQTLRLERRYAADDGELFGIVDAPGDLWLASSAVFAESEADALRALVQPRFDYRRQVILVRSDGATDVPLDLDKPAPMGQARLIGQTNNRLLAEVASSRGGWLVVAHTWDPGWRASVDGRPAELLRANYAFRAVRVPPGSHSVEMRYLPVGMPAGLALSLLAALALVLAASWTGSGRARGSARSDVPRRATASRPGGQ